MDETSRTGPEDAQARAAANRRFLARGTAFMLLDNASKALEPLLVLLCAKAYAGGDWGIFKYYESLALLLTRLASLGLDRGVVWMYSRCADEGDFVRRFSRCVNLVLLLAAAVGALVLLQRLGRLPDVLDWKDKLPPALPLQLALFLAAVPLQALTLLFLQALLNKRVLYQGLLVRNLAVPLFTYGPALLMSLTAWKPIGLALPYFLGNLAGLVLAAGFFLKAYSGGRSRWSLAPGASRELLRFSLPLASTDFFMSFAYRVDLLLLGRYSGIKEVEIYSVIMMIANTLRSLRQSFDGIMLSVFSAEAAGAVTAEQRRNFNYASWMVTAMQVPFFFLALFFGRELLGLIGPTYAEGHRVLVVATFFSMLLTPGAFSGQLLLGLGKTHVIPVTQAIFFAVNVGLNVLMVPRYGAVGAAAATGFSVMLGGLMALAAVRWYSRSFILSGRFFLDLLVGLAIFAVATAADLLWRPSLPGEAALFLAALAAYAWHARACWRRYHRRA